MTMWSTRVTGGWHLDVTVGSSRQAPAESGTLGARAERRGRAGQDTMDHGSTLLTPEEMARADAAAIAAGTPGRVLMENAGYAVADDVCGRHRQGTRVAVVCGPGNNGGDGFVVARVLAERGYVVRLGLLGDVGSLKGDAAAAAARWRRPVEAAGLAVLDGAAVIVDALFGAGLSRPLDGAAAAMVEAVNAAGRAGAVVVAVDLPSGVDGRTGATPGPAVVARRTVTFFRRKPGHLLMPGRAHCGLVRTADIGIADTVLDIIGARTFANGPALFGRHWPHPGADAHKYSRGAALVVGGPVASCGAARLAAAAALRTGAGIVSVAVPADAVATVAAYRAALVVKAAESGFDLAALIEEPRLAAILVGPGGGTGGGPAGPSRRLSPPVPQSFSTQTPSRWRLPIPRRFSTRSAGGGAKAARPASS